MAVSEISLESARVIEQLRAHAATCAAPGWDGYGGEPVSADALAAAIAFVEAIPEGVEMPAVGAEPDGHITLEWYRSPEQVLSVSVAPDRMIYYAAILGVGRANGAELFSDAVPDPILRLISRLPRA